MAVAIPELITAVRQHLVLCPVGHMLDLQMPDPMSRLRVDDAAVFPLTVFNDLFHIFDQNLAR